MFAGTSTGSIVAAGLALADLPVSVLARLYLDLSAVIFGSRLSAAQRSLRLRAIMAAVFGGHTSLHAAAAAADAYDAGRHASQRAAAAAAGRVPPPLPPPKRFMGVATDASTVRCEPFSLLL
jgi:hypothetical protein